MALTPAQRACAWFFFVMAALFLIQTFVGAASQHYRAELDSFFGFDLAAIFPYNLMRTWHVQLALFWVATSFVAAGIFLAPMIARREPKHQGKLAFALLGALAVVVFGTLIGSFLGIHGILEDGIQLVRAPGLRVPRPRPDLAGAAVHRPVRSGSSCSFACCARRLRSEHPGNMPWLFFLAACAIPAFYAVGLIARTSDHFTVTEFWRFWVVHLWVEDFLELFTTVMVAYMFVLLGVVRERVALTVDLPRHHPVLVRRRHRDDAPPVLLRRAGRAHGARRVLLGRRGDPAHVPDRRGMGVPAARRGAGVAGADAVPAPLGGDVPRRRRILELPRRGIFGFLINLPVVSYYEIGTALTANHGHAAMMGVYGMLAIGLALFCLRYLIPADRWPEKWAKISFWSTNIGLAWMCFATLLPLGILQLYESVNNGYFEARELKFLTSDTNALIEWLRLPGDIVFIAGGAVPTLYIAYLGIRHTVKRVTLEEPEDILFTEVVEPEGVPSMSEEEAAAARLR